MDEIVKSLKGKPTLTAADADGQAFAGAIIRFFVENKLRAADAAPPGRAP